MLQGEIIANFWIEVSDVSGLKWRSWCAATWRRLGKVHILLHVRAKGDSPVHLAMTHMRWSHGQSGQQSTGCTQSVVLCVGGLRAWPID